MNPIKDYVSAKDNQITDMPDPINFRSAMVQHQVAII